MKNLACLHLHPGSEPKLDYFLEPDATYAFYKGMAVKFLRDLSDRSSPLNSSGTALMFIEDNGTLPSHTLQQLRDIRVPFLSHAIRGRANAATAILIPDFHFIQHEGFLELEKLFGDKWIPLKNRIPQVFWRGSTTGSLDSLVSSNSSQLNIGGACQHLQRAVACATAKAGPWLDLGLTQGVQYCGNEFDILNLKENRLMKPPVEEHAWSNYRGILEVDGNVNAWGNKWRLMTGSVLFKVESDYFNSYVIEEKPYKHYIPIKRDLSDLVEKTKVITTKSLTELAKLQRIARAAVQLGSKYSYRSEILRVALELNKIWRI